MRVVLINYFHNRNNISTSFRIYVTFKQKINIGRVVHFYKIIHTISVITRESVMLPLTACAVRNCSNYSSYFYAAFILVPVTHLFIYFFGRGRHIKNIKFCLYYHVLQCFDPVKLNNYKRLIRNTSVIQR